MLSAWAVPLLTGLAALLLRNHIVVAVVVVVVAAAMGVSTLFIQATAIHRAESRFPGSRRRLPTRILKIAPLSDACRWTPTMLAG